MKIFNLGFGEILFIILLAVIIFGPKGLVKTAREAGAFLRKVTKSPYWKEVWATKRDIEEIPKILAKEARLDDTIREINLDTRKISSSVTGAVSDLIREVDQQKPGNTPAAVGTPEAETPAAPKEPPTDKL
jgi:Sec-independent protein translocase protein TatA